MPAASAMCKRVPCRLTSQIKLLHQADFKQAAFRASSAGTLRQPVVPAQTHKSADLPGLSAETLKWFANRKISVETLKRNQIGEQAMSSMSPKTSIAAVFPFICDGQIVGHKYRSIGRHRQFSQSGSVKVYYGVDDVVGHDTIIIVEGEMDKLSLEEAGFKNVISIPHGAPAAVRAGPLPEQDRDKGFGYVWQCWAATEQASTIILGSDWDLAGHALAEELACRLGRERCLRVDWSMGTSQEAAYGQRTVPQLPVCTDANEVLVQHGINALKYCIAKAKPVPVDGPFQVVGKKRKKQQQPAAGTSTQQTDSLSADE